MKISFQRAVRLVAVLALILYGVALVDYVLHPLAGDHNFGSPIYRAALMLGIIPLTLLVTFLIIKRTPGNVVGLLLIVWTGTLAYNTLRADLNPQLFAILAWYDIAFGWSGLLLMLQHFPNGEISPRRVARWVYRLVGISPVINTLIFFSMANLQVPSRIVNPYFLPELEPYAEPILYLSLLVFSPVLIMAIISPVMHYIQGSSRERQQIKWLALFGGLTIVYSIPALIIIPILTGTETMEVGTNLTGLIYYLTVSLFPPLTIGIAILRHHLWDIDLIIRRTLVYSVLSLALAGVYLAAVTIFQFVLTALIGHESSLAIALSTLAAAALFNPLRKRVQAFIDRRFYRRKYDAELALAEFAAAARSETDLRKLTQSLTGAVQETVNPQQVSLWIRKR